MASAESRSGCTVVAHFSTGQGGEQHGSGKEKATGDPLAPFARLNKRLISTAGILISDQPSGDPLATTKRVLCTQGTSV